MVLSCLVLSQDFQISPYHIFIFSVFDLPSAHPDWEDPKMKSEKHSIGLKSLNQVKFSLTIYHETVKVLPDDLA